MRPRLVVLAIALAASAACLVGFSSSSASFAAQTSPPPATTAPPTTTEPTVEVGGKVVVQSPEKSPVSDDLARTGSDHAVVMAATGLMLAGVGLVLVDLTRAPMPAARPLPRRRPPPRQRVRFR